MIFAFIHQHQKHPQNNFRLLNKITITRVIKGQVKITRSQTNSILLYTRWMSKKISSWFNGSLLYDFVCCNWITLLLLLVFLVNLSNTGRNITFIWLYVYSLYVCDITSLQVIQVYLRQYSVSLVWTYLSIYIVYIFPAAVGRGGA